MKLINDAMKEHALLKTMRFSDKVREISGSMTPDELTTFFSRIQSAGKITYKRSRLASAGSELLPFVMKLQTLAASQASVDMPAAKPAPKPEAKPEAKPAPKPAPKVERTIILDDVLFDFDKSNVKPEAAAILDRLVAFMKENSDKKANLSGHTDNVGTDAYNQALSERRVSSVKDYVVGKGVDGGRVSGQGFGESKPIADNKTAEGRSKNRRVEIKVN